MAIRQYIGARYVTKIYENSLDPSSAEWEAGVTYEPLTMVTYNNSSYLSKKEVPGTIGDPASNPTYWVLTGAYNGQILNLQNQIDAINDSISDIVNGITIFIGDSYGSVNSYGIPTTLASLLGKTIGTDFFYSAEGGSGFIGNGYANTFLEQLQSLTIANPNAVSNIIFCGGINDNGSTSSAIMSAMATAKTYIDSTYPNAKVHVGYISRSLDHTAIYDKYGSTLVGYKNGALSRGWAFIDDSPIWLDYVYIDTDGLHPTATGSNVLAWQLSNYLRGSKGSYFHAPTTFTFTFDQTGISGSASITIAKMHNGLFNVNFGDCIIGLTGFTGGSFSSGVKLASVSQKFIDSVNYKVGSIPVTFFCRYVINGVTSWRLQDGNLKLTVDGLYLKFSSPDQTAESMTGLWFNSVTNMLLDPMTC